MILSGVRTPVGRYGGALSGQRPDDLGALVIRQAVARAEAIGAYEQPVRVEFVA